MFSSLKVVRLQVLKLFAQVRFWIVFAILALTVFCFIQPYVDIALEHNIALTPYAFPIISSDHIAQLAIVMGAIVLFANAPWLDKQTPYLVSRSGIHSWWCGNLLAVVLIALIYVLAILFFSIVCTLPCLTLSTAWGDGWSKMGNYEFVSEYYRAFEIPTSILEHYSAPNALLISIFLEWILIIWLGWMIMVFNRASGRALGTPIASIWIVLDMGLCNLLPPFLVRISPASLSMLSTPIEYEWMNITFIDSILFLGGGLFIFATGYVAIEKLLTLKKGGDYCDY